MQGQNDIRVSVCQQTSCHPTCIVINFATTLHKDHCISKNVTHNNITILMRVTVRGITNTLQEHQEVSFLPWLAHWGERVIYLKITISSTQKLAVSHTSPRLPLMSWQRHCVWRHNTLRPLITPHPSTQLCCAKELENVWQSNLMPQLVFWTWGDVEKWLLLSLQI